MAVKGYVHSNARGGGVPHQGKHYAGLSAVSSKTSHLTQPSGGAKCVGDLPQTAKTPMMKNDMGPVKKVAGGSNYGKK